MRRFQVIRDDGDMYIGLGMSYSHYQFDGDTWQLANHDWSKFWPVDTANRWVLRDIAACLGTPNADNHNLFSVRELH